MPQIPQTDAVAERSSVVTVIRPTSGPIPPRLGELWAYRELFSFLILRDLKVRYAQTTLGTAWMIFQPLAMMAVYTFAFSHLAKVAIPGVPYPVFALSGLVLWIFISRGVQIGSESLLTNLPLVTKTACPRILLTLSAVVATLADLLIALIIFLAFSTAYGIYPTWRFALALPLIAVTFVLVFGLSLLLSAVNVRYRDVSQALPFLLQLWFFLSPVAYLLVTPGRSWQTIVQGVNPAVGLILAFRWSLLGTPPPRGLFIASCATTVLIAVVGLWNFSRAERTIADEI